MSLIEAAIGIIADVVTDGIKKNQIKKKIKRLEASSDELDREYEASLNVDFMNSESAKEIISQVEQAKHDDEASRKSLFNREASTIESQVSEASKNNITYNNVIKEIVAMGVRKKEKEKEKYLREKEAIENKIFSAEIAPTSTSSSPFSNVNIDFTRKSDMQW
ncbi:MAG: hypothetical protein RRZ64_07100 [Rikenellaceae bacterium]